MNDTTQNPELGYADDGSRVESAELKTQQIEDMLNRFDELVDTNDRSYKNFMFTSLAWSYKHRLARSITILLDMNAGLADAQEREQKEREETLVEAIRKVEAQVDELTNLYNWAAVQSNPQLLPSCAEVIANLQTERETDSDLIKEYAEALKITEEEAKTDLDGVTSPDVQRAVKFKDPALHELEQRTKGHYDEFTFSDWNAVSTMEKIAEKAEAYMLKNIDLFKRTRRKSHRTHLVSNKEAFQRIMDEADKLAVKYRNDVEIAQQKAEEMKSAMHEADVPVMS